MGDYNAEFISARVLPDNLAIGRVGAEHFFGRGFQHYAFFRFDSVAVVTERMEGFRKAVLQRGYHFHDINFETAPESKNSPEHLQPLLFREFVGDALNILAMVNPQQLLFHAPLTKAREPRDIGVGAAGRERGGVRGRNSCRYVLRTLYRVPLHCIGKRLLALSWLRKLLIFNELENGAGDETRTRDIFLGKEVLYQLSYTRI